MEQRVLMDFIFLLNLQLPDSLLLLLPISLLIDKKMKREKVNRVN